MTMTKRSENQSLFNLEAPASRKVRWNASG